MLIVPSIYYISLSPCRNFYLEFRNASMCHLNEKINTVFLFGCTMYQNFNGNARKNDRLTTATVKYSTQYLLLYFILFIW